MRMSLIDGTEKEQSLEKHLKFKLPSGLGLCADSEITKKSRLYIVEIW